MSQTAVDEKALEKMLARELQALEGRDDEEFHQALKDLLSEFGFTARDAASILTAEERARSQPMTRMKVFRNPYTRETIRTYGYNHAKLNEWRRRHGRITVQAWQIR